MKIKATVLAIMMSTSLGTQAGALSLDELTSLNKNAYSNPNAVVKYKDEKKDAYLNVMREAALELGAQHGYASTMADIRDELIAETHKLDKIYDFATLMKLASTGGHELHYLPPAIQQAEEVKSNINPDTLRLSGRQYNIIKKERLVTSPPDWRDYLLTNTQYEIGLPSQLFVPKTAHERALWKNWITEGWNAGVMQADRVMTRKIRKLGAEFAGMYRYIRLMGQGKVKATMVVKTYNDVVGGGDSMAEQETIYRIAAPAQLNPNHGQWKARVVDNRETLR
ncbi:type IV secretory system conjugative DNA transfer family protein [Neptuniibacter sp. QD37_11]|uniref:type IV secretory system conjugative DNA transfer family protein n=1 Tax=Neptuniibacter sp. QD37_11 TaxID=3398209 RepID=UPI0039F4B4A7